MNVKKILGSLVVGLMLGAAVFVPVQESQAAAVKLSDFKCEAFLKLPADSVTPMLFWFHGAATIALMNDSFDDASLTKFSEAFAAHCQAKPGDSVEAATEAAATAAGMVE